MMTRLNKTAFDTLLTASIITILGSIISSIIYFMRFSDDFSVICAVFALTIIITLAYQTPILYMTINHNIYPRKGRYLIVMLVLNIIALIPLLCFLIFILYVIHEGFLINNRRLSFFDTDVLVFMFMLWAVFFVKPIVEIIGVRIHRNNPRPLPPSNDGPPPPSCNPYKR